MTHTNRLAAETSPYLLQHAHNPVDWYPWGDAAFAAARDGDRPIFLSVGYSTCHWCHVMERESFESEEIAAVLNAHFVPIKVDREERPDIDEIYMNATQLMTHHGGWPNSVWLTPDRRPWYAGTYFPPDDRGGRPGFKTMLERLAEMWRTRRDEVEEQADHLADAIRQMAGSHAGVSGTTEDAEEPVIDRSVIDAAISELGRHFDRRYGGFGGAPKFPPHGSLRLLLEEHRRTGDSVCLDMATATLDAMAHGGIHDHVGGGFHRYATDAHWLLPHFEKMLYDNAQLGRSYVDAFATTGRDEYAETARGIYDWALREMVDAGGGFHSALDADSEGVEGKFYVWSHGEIDEILGDDAELFCRVYGIEERGNFQDEATHQRTGANIPHRAASWKETATREGMSLADLCDKLRECRERLLQARDGRIRPHLDDKVLTSWNGLMIGSLAHAGDALEEPRYIEAARRAAAFLLDSMRENGRNLRSYRDGAAHLNAYLDDYAFLADGLLDLHEATGDESYLAAAREQLDVLLKHHRADGGAGFYFTSDDHEELLIRSRDPYDKAIPSGNGVAARALVRIGRALDDRGYVRTAEEALASFRGAMERAPRGTEALILACAELLAKRGGESQPQPVDWADVEVGRGPVRVSGYASLLVVKPGHEVRVAVRIAVDDGWHLDSHDAAGEATVPTTLSLAAGAPAEKVIIEHPAGDDVTVAGDTLSVYRGETWIFATLQISDDAKVGVGELPFELRLRPCSGESCQEPGTISLALPIRIDVEAPARIRHPGIFERRR